MEITVYVRTYKDEPSGELHLSLEPHKPKSELTVDTLEADMPYLADDSLSWGVEVPDGSALERDSIGRMALAHDHQDHRIHSTANEVWSFAKLNLHGFRLLGDQTNEAV